jgi:hypothetical protein
MTTVSIIYIPQCLYILDIFKAYTALPLSCASSPALPKVIVYCSTYGSLTSDEYTLSMICISAIGSIITCNNRHEHITISTRTQLFSNMRNLQNRRSKYMSIHV